MAHAYSFPKSERIFLQKEIDTLFNEGNSFISYPLRVIYVVQPPVSGSRAAILISVPKKRVRRAVGRNRIKRLVREAYRLNKPGFISSLEEQNKHLLIAFVYIGSGDPEYATMEAAIVKAFNILTVKLKEE